MDLVGLRGERIRLVPPDHTQHLENALRWMNDPAVTDTLNTVFGVTRRGEEQWFERTETQREHDLVWAVLDEEDRHIGFAGLHRIDWVNRCGTGGVSIGERSAWGKGYGTDVVRTRMRFVFDQLGLHRLQGETFAFNVAMQRIYEKCGYVREGTSRERIWRNGRWWDLYHYAILAPEYAARRGG